MVFAWEAIPRKKFVNFFEVQLCGHKTIGKNEKEKVRFSLFLFNNIAVLGIG